MNLLVCAFWLTLPINAPDTFIEWTFVPDLTLGSEEGGDELLFSANTVFAIRKDGSIAILDTANKRVQLFSASGAFQKTLGGAGEGPGEFNSPSEITADKAGNLYVFDAEADRISVFDASGAFSHTLSLPTGTVGLIQPTVLDNGNILLSTVQMNAQQQQVYRLTLFDARMEALKLLVERAQPTLDWNQSNQQKFWVGFLKDHLESLGRGFPLAAANGDGFVWVETHRFGGTLMDVNGGEVGSFTRNDKPLFMTEAMKQVMCEAIYQKVTSSGPVARFLPHPVFTRAMAEAELPATVNPIAQLFAADGGFGVLSNYDMVDHRGRITVFDQAGRAVGGGDYQGLAASVKWFDGKWYTMGENEDGTQVLTRYAAKRK